MVRRFACHHLLVGAGSVISCGGIGLDADRRVCEVFSLDDKQVETANTVFVDGWIAPFFLEPSSLAADSLSQKLNAEALRNRKSVVVGQVVPLFSYQPQPDGSVNVIGLTF